MYQQHVVDICDIAIVAGAREVHIVPPKWCTLKSNNTLDLSECHYVEPHGTEIGKLACLPLFLATIKLLIYHDTGSSITLHAASYRERQPQATQRMITKVGTGNASFRGIMRRQTSLMADVYKWELGWRQQNSSVHIISVEIPDSLINPGHVSG